MEKRISPEREPRKKKQRKFDYNYKVQKVCEYSQKRESFGKFAKDAGIGRFSIQLWKEQSDAGILRDYRGGIKSVAAELLKRIDEVVNLSNHKWSKMDKIKLPSHWARQIALDYYDELIASGTVVRREPFGASDKWLERSVLKANGIDYVTFVRQQSSTVRHIGDEFVAKYFRGFEKANHTSTETAGVAPLIAEKTKDNIDGESLPMLKAFRECSILDYFRVGKPPSERSVIAESLPSVDSSNVGAKEENVSEPSSAAPKKSVVDLSTDSSDEDYPEAKSITKESDGFVKLVALPQRPGPGFCLICGKPTSVCVQLYKGQYGKRGNFSNPMTGDLYGLPWRENSCSYDSGGSQMQGVQLNLNTPAQAKFANALPEISSIVGDLSSGKSSTVEAKIKFEEYLSRRLYDRGIEIYNKFLGIIEHKDVPASDARELIVCDTATEVFTTYIRRNLDCQRCKFTCSDEISLNSLDIWDFTKDIRNAVRSSIGTYERYCPICNAMMLDKYDIAQGPMVLICTSPTPGAETMPNCVTFAGNSYLLSGCIYGDNSHYISFVRRFATSEIYKCDGMRDKAKYTLQSNSSFPMYLPGVPLTSVVEAYYIRESDAVLPFQAMSNKDHTDEVECIVGHIDDSEFGNNVVEIISTGTKIPAETDVWDITTDEYDELQSVLGSISACVDQSLGDVHLKIKHLGPRQYQDMRTAASKGVSAIEDFLVKQTIALHVIVRRSLFERFYSYVEPHGYCQYICAASIGVFADGIRDDRDTLPLTLNNSDDQDKQERDRQAILHYYESVYEQKGHVHCNDCMDKVKRALDIMKPQILKGAFMSLGLQYWGSSDIMQSIATKSKLPIAVVFFSPSPGADSSSYYSLQWVSRTDIGAREQAYDFRSILDLVSKSFSKFATTFTVLYDGSHFFMPDWETLDYLHTNLEPALLFLAQAIFNVLQNNATRLAVRAVVGKETKPPIKSIRASERLSKKQVPAARGNPRLEVASGGGEVYIKESSYNLVLDKLIPSLLSVSSPQLLHIGPGEGQEICQLIRALLVTDKAKMNYCGRIDIVAVEVVTRFGPLIIGGIGDLADGIAPDNDGWFNFSESLRFKLIIGDGVQYLESNIHDVTHVYTTAVNGLPFYVDLLYFTLQPKIRIMQYIAFIENFLLAGKPEDFIHPAFNRELNTLKSLFRDNIHDECRVYFSSSKSNEGRRVLFMHCDSVSGKDRDQILKILKKIRVAYKER